MPTNRGPGFLGYKVKEPENSRNFFYKSMKKSSFACMTVPAQFVRQHGEKFQDCVTVQYNGGRAKWNVKVNKNIKNGRAHVAFGDGWMDFAGFYNIKEGDHVKFSLVGPYCFHVTCVD